MSIYALGHSFAEHPTTVEGSTHFFPLNLTLAKWALNGAILWEKDIRGKKTAERGYCLAVEGASGSVYVAGSSIPNTDYTADIKSSVFLGQYTPRGTEQWVGRPSSDGWDDAFGIAVGPADRVYTVGSTG